MGVVLFGYQFDGVGRGGGGAGGVVLPCRHVDAVDHLGGDKTAGTVRNGDELSSLRYRLKAVQDRLLTAAAARRDALELGNAVRLGKCKIGIKILTARDENDLIHRIRHLMRQQRAGKHGDAVHLKQLLGHLAAHAGRRACRGNECCGLTVRRGGTDGRA